MKILITGGCGFLGSNLSAHILDNKLADLIVIDNLFREGSDQNLKWLKSKGTFTYRHLDIRNVNDIESSIKETRPDIIFHLAGQVAMTTSIKNPRFDFEINTLGSFNILDSVKKYSPDCIVIYSSTNKVYGDLDWVKYNEEPTRYTSHQFPKGFDESIPLDFCSPYGCSKGSADQYMLDYYRLFGIRTVVFRHSSMYGGRQFTNYDQGWIGWFCEKAIETKNKTIEKPFIISGTGKQVRDVLHADDMITLYFKTIANIDQAKGNAFNIGGGIENSLSLLELFSILQSELDIEMKFEKIAPRESDQKIFVANILKAKKHIDWHPVVDKVAGIRRMIDWVEERNG